MDSLEYLLGIIFLLTLPVFSVQFQKDIKNWLKPIFDKIKTRCRKHKDNER